VIALKYYNFIFSFLAVFWFVKDANSMNEEQAINSHITVESPWNTSPFNLTAGVEYQSNIDLLDEKIYPSIYKDVVNLNLNGKITFSKKISQGELTYKPSIDVKLMEASHYLTKQDILRNLEINQNLYLKHASSTEKFSWGPTFDLNYRKYYTYGGWRRIRDYASALVGLNTDYSLLKKMNINATVKVGYLDHYGNYVNPDEAHRANEKKLQEDRMQYKGSLTAVYSLSEKTTISIPLTYSLDDYSEKKVRAGNDPIDRDMLKFNIENNLPYNDPTLNLQKVSAGFDVLQAFEAFEASLSYSFTDVKELNDGHGRNNADDNIISFSLSYKNENLSVGIDYSYETYKFQNLVGGEGLEITNSYGMNLKIKELFQKTILQISLSRIHGSYWYHDGWTEKPTNDSFALQLNRVF